MLKQLYLIMSDKMERFSYKDGNVNVHILRRLKEELTWAIEK